MTTVPPNPAIAKLRINVIDVPPASLMSWPSTRPSAGPFASPGGQRRKLWEFSTSMHCSIVGTCLSTLELRKIIAKVKGHDLKGFSDLIVHEEAVLVAGHQGAAARLLQKALDRRYEATIKRFNRAQNVEEVHSLWDDARRSGDVPGAYWALLTHPATTQELRQSAFGDVHMLSHLVGSTNRADIRRLATLETERAELALKVEKQQAQLRDVIVTRDVTIRRLNDMLAETIAHESRARPSGRSQEDADEIIALHGLVADLQRRLSAEVSRRQRAEQRHEMAQSALSKANAALGAAYDEAQHLREELDAAEAQLSSTTGSNSEGLCHRPVSLNGVRLLHVGGRPAQIPRIRAFVEAAQGEFLHHDGGVEERKGLLAGLVSRADTVFFPVDCISHEAARGLKRLCRQAAKPYFPLRSTSLASFIAALSRVEQTGLRARQ
jgi:Uncharacterized protein conserved in bacteria (DUF2325)